MILLNPHLTMLLSCPSASFSSAMMVVSIHTKLFHRLTFEIFVSVSPVLRSQTCAASFHVSLCYLPSFSTLLVWNFVFENLGTGCYTPHFLVRPQQYDPFFIHQPCISCNKPIGPHTPPENFCPQQQSKLLGVQQALFSWVWESL